MGFDSTIQSLHLLHALLVYISMSQRIYLDDTLGVFEWFLWSLNIGYFVYEMIEAYDKGLRHYFTFTAWIICCSLFGCFMCIASGVIIVCQTSCTIFWCTACML
eukprot:297899_1